ncbi:hypothetical protein [Micromonospora sp. NPDC050495]|uniref:hypothetical protein n=1 Tax=Micromonospora sp. NPDC050495 TaxID=3154936 RepID=UPI0033E097DA
MSSPTWFDAAAGGQPAIPAAVPPAQPVFVDATGARRRRVRRTGVLVAVASLSYLPMAASGLLPAPAAPLLPGRLSVGGTPETPPTIQPGPTPSPSDALSPEPEQGDTWHAPGPAFAAPRPTATWRTSPPPVAGAGIPAPVVPPVKVPRVPAVPPVRLPEKPAPSATAAPTPPPAADPAPSSPPDAGTAG